LLLQTKYFGQLDCPAEQALHFPKGLFGFEEEKEFNDCEYNIFNLALQSDFDGILILSNNIASYSRLEILMGQIKDRKIPCISIEHDVPDFHFIGTDNYTAMSEVVEHLITVHGCRVLNFVC